MATITVSHLLFSKFNNLDRNHTLVRETQFQAYKENKDAFFSSATVPETHLEDTSNYCS